MPAHGAAEGALVYEPSCSNAGCPSTDVALRAKATAHAEAASVTVLVLGLTHNTKNNDDANSDQGCPQVRKIPSRPRSWANFSLLPLYSQRNTWANVHLLGQPNTLLAAVP